LATICWVIETYYGDSNFAKTLQIGIYGKQGLSTKTNNGDDVIDV